MKPLSTCYCLVGDFEFVEVFDGDTYLIPRRVYENFDFSSHRAKRLLKCYEISSILADALHLP